MSGASTCNATLLRHQWQRSVRASGHVGGKPWAHVAWHRRVWARHELRHPAQRVIYMMSRLWETSVSLLASPKTLYWWRVCGGQCLRLWPLWARRAYSARWHWAVTWVNFTGRSAISTSAVQFQLDPVPAALQSQPVPRFHIVMVCQAMKRCVLFSSPFILNA